MKRKTGSFTSMTDSPIDIHDRVGGQPPGERVEWMWHVLPDQVSRVDVAQVMGDGHEVIDSASLEVGLFRVELEQGRRRVLAVKHHVKVASEMEHSKRVKSEHDQSIHLLANLHGHKLDLEQWNNFETNFYDRSKGENHFPKQAKSSCFISILLYRLWLTLVTWIESLVVPDEGVWRFFSLLFPGN